MWSSQIFHIPLTAVAVKEWNLQSLATFVPRAAFLPEGICQSLAPKPLTWWFSAQSKLVLENTGWLIPRLNSIKAQTCAGLSSYVVVQITLLRHLQVSASDLCQPWGRSVLYCQSVFVYHNVSEPTWWVLIQFQVSPHTIQCIFHF